jgi:hypothetical protein
VYKVVVVIVIESYPHHSANKIYTLELLTRKLLGVYLKEEKAFLSLNTRQVPAPPGGFFIALGESPATRAQGWGGNWIGGRKKTGACAEKILTITESG